MARTKLTRKAELAKQRSKAASKGWETRRANIRQKLAKVDQRKRAAEREQIRTKRVAAGKKAAETRKRHERELAERLARLPQPKQRKKAKPTKPLVRLDWSKYVHPLAGVGPVRQRKRAAAPKPIIAVHPLAAGGRPSAKKRRRSPRGKTAGAVTGKGEVKRGRGPVYDWIFKNRVLTVQNTMYRAQQEGLAREAAIRLAEEYSVEVSAIWKTFNGSPDESLAA